MYFIAELIGATISSFIIFLITKKIANKLLPELKLETTLQGCAWLTFFITSALSIIGYYDESSYDNSSIILKAIILRGISASLIYFYLMNKNQKKESSESNTTKEKTNNLSLSVNQEELKIEEQLVSQIYTSPGTNFNREYYLFLKNDSLFHDGVNFSYRNVKITPIMIKNIQLINGINNIVIKTKEFSDFYTNDNYLCRIEYRNYSGGVDHADIYMSEIRSDSRQDLLCLIDILHKEISGEKITTHVKEHYEEKENSTTIEFKQNETAAYKRNKMEATPKLHDSSIVSQENPSLNNQSKFEEIKSLRDKGYITEEDYLKCKEEMLKNILKSA